MSEIIKIIKERRSIRRYKDKKVPREFIETLLECAVYAPSAMHEFPWKFIVIENKEKIKELSEKAKKTLKFLGLGEKFAERATSQEDLIFYNAPLVIIITCRGGLKWGREDTALAVENMFLAAKSLGLGSCWIGLAQGLDKDEETRKELGIPEDYEITAVLIFGYPHEKGKFHKRKAQVLKWWK